MSPELANLIAEIKDTTVSLTDSQRQARDAVSKLQGLIEARITPSLKQADREIRLLKADNAKLMAACRAAYESIARFPGSVHDHAMSKLDRVVHPSRPRVYPDCEVEADRRRQEADRLRAGLSSLGIAITPEIEILIKADPRVDP